MEGFLYLNLEVNSGRKWFQMPANQSIFPKFSGGGPHRRSEKVILQGAVDIIEESHGAKLDGESERHGELRRNAIRTIREYLKAKVRGRCEHVEGHLNKSRPRLAYRLLGLSRSADGVTLSEETEIRARWVAYLEELYRVDVDPPSRVFSANDAVTLVTGTHGQWARRRPGRSPGIGRVSERHRQVDEVLLAAYIDFRKASESICSLVEDP